MIPSGPSSRTLAATARSTSSHRLTSPSTNVVRPPVAAIAATVSLPPSGRRSMTATAAPWDASARAIARPIPEPPPVTRALPPRRVTGRRVGAPEAERRDERQAPRASGQDGGKLRGSHAAERMADQVRAVDAERRDELVVGEREVEEILERLDAGRARDAGMRRRVHAE